MNFNNIAQPWTTSPRQTPRLPVKGNDSFFWMHHPKNWELWVFKTEQTTKKKKGEELVTVNTPLWIPKLTKLIEQPGVNNITNEGSMVNSSYAQSIFIDRGFTILQHRDHDYLRMYPAMGGKFYTHKWVSMELIGGELLRTTDQEGLAAWKKSLISSGSLDLPHTGILRLKIKKMKDALFRLGKRMESKSNTKELQLEEQKLEYAEQALANLQKYGIDNYE